jgi:hypothetical protein
MADACPKASLTRSLGDRRSKVKTPRSMERHGGPVTLFATAPEPRDPPPDATERFQTPWDQRVGGLSNQGLSRTSRRGSSCCYSIEAEVSGRRRRSARASSGDVGIVAKSLVAHLAHLDGVVVRVGGSLRPGQFERGR